MNFNLILFFAGILIFLTLIWVIRKLFNIIPHPSLKLLRILFPSWRFFEGLTPVPKIFYRFRQNGTHYSEWLPLLQTDREFIADIKSDFAVKFLSKVNDNSELEFSVETQPVTDSKLQTKPQRNFKKLFNNSEENLNLTYLGQIEQLINDISELEPSPEHSSEFSSELPSASHSLSIESLTSYKIVYAYIKEQILLRHSAHYFQFKIGALVFNPNSHHSEWSESLYSNDCELL